MPDGKKYKVRVIIEGSEGNHLQLGGWRWDWKWRAFPLLPPHKSLLSRGKTIACNIFYRISLFGEVRE